MVRFLHAADLHLGLRVTRFAGKTADQIREARFLALERIRDEAGRRDPAYDFVVIAGDLFDDAHVGRSIANRAHHLLESFPVPVLLIPGNHDPFEPGSLWESAPWDAPAGKRVRLLTAREPWTELPGVTVFPCPVFRKRSAENPTRWIADHPRAGSGMGGDVRIGIAHGSVMDRPDLPDDDHPISPSAPADLDLDYLALGHWHRQKTYTDAGGGVRMAYPGVHEPMRFRDDSQASGWRPYSGGMGREEFLDDGDGTAYSVSIDGPGAAPRVEPVNVRHLRWITRRERVESEEQFDELVRRTAEGEQVERTLLKLVVDGALPVHVAHRLDELREVLGRYAYGELIENELAVEPTAEEIREMIGGGVLGQVHERLRQLAQGSGEPSHNGNGPIDAETIERATRLLYRFAARSQDA
jgi:DNA repair exonuclease SbcCD nuclease subunit